LSSRNSTPFAVRASRILRVRVTAVRVLLFRWWDRPPRPQDVTETIRSGWRLLLESGPRGLLGAINAGVHELAREGSRNPLNPWIRERLGLARYRFEYQWLWIPRYDRLRRREIRAIQQSTALLAYQPLLSVIMPVYNSDERWLRAAIRSVEEQLYPNWELCIADDHSTKPGVAEVLREIQARERRIKLHFRDVNGHISAASNSALALAWGEFVVLLDHDDVLPRHALAAVVHELNRHPDADIIYSDEDRLDESGRRYDPYFKPDWNAELLYGQNLISHLGVYRTAMVRKVGGFQQGFEGSQDYEMALRIIERTQPDRIRHIPLILYHWRAIEGSTALAREAKDYASAAGVRAVAEHLQRTGGEAEAEELPHGHYRVRWRIPQQAPKVSLIVPTRDKAGLLRTCIESVRERTTYPSFEVVVVDNQSSEPAAVAYLAGLERHRGVRVLHYDAPFNYSKINNWAAGQCDGAVIGLVNNDIEVISPGWLDEMVSQAMRPEVGAVGAMLYYPNDTIQHAGVVLGVHGVAAHLYADMPRGYAGHGGRALVTQSLSAVTGACLLVRRAAYEQVGGLDESLQVAFNDIDFCLRLRAAGYRNVWTPFAELYHHESASRGSEDTDEKKERFAREVDLMQQRWGEQLQFDPAYNVNLSLSSPCCELSSPPRAAGTAAH